MSEPRFIVATVEGHPIHLGANETSHTPGLSAHVLDTFNLYAVVASFRSETRNRGKGSMAGGKSSFLGRARALAAAEAEADRLNRWAAEAEAA